MPLVQAEGQARFEDEARVLAEMVIGRVLAAFHRAILHRIIHLQGGDDFACGENTDLELAIGHVMDGFGELLSAAEQRIERFREGRGMAPADFRHGLGQRRSCKSGGGNGGGAKACLFDEVTTFHCGTLPVRKG